MMKRALLDLILLLVFAFGMETLFNPSVVVAQQQPAPLPLLANAANTGPVFTWLGGQGVFEAVGTFGGATVTLQFLGPDGTTWVAAGAGTTFTSANAGVFVLPFKTQIRAAVTGAGGTTALYATATQSSTTVSQ